MGHAAEVCIVLLHIKVFWDLILCLYPVFTSLSCFYMAATFGLLSPEDKVRLFLQNVRKYLPNITASHPTRSKFSFSSYGAVAQHRPWPPPA
jgi:hypothetical protein